MVSIEEEIKTLCRLCGENENDILFDIFETDVSNKISLNELIVSILDISTTNNENLPKNICITCKNAVTKFYNFKEKCSKIDGMFQQIIQNSYMNKSHSTEGNIKNKNVTKPLEIIYVEDNTTKYLIKDPEIINKQMIDVALQCSQCLKVYSTRSSLLRHRKSCIMINENNKFSCERCGEILASSLTLKLHIDKHEHDENTIQEKLENKTTKTPDKILCQYCGKLFKKSNDLKIHLISHTKLKIYECPDCDKKFSIHSRLKDHMNQHLNEKKFLCKICEKSFFTYRNLYKHKKIHDSQYRRHHCTLCPKLFAYPYQLQTHMMVHTGNRPHICQLCYAKFRFNWDLQKHITKNHTAEKLPPDVITSIMYEDILETSDVNILNLDEYTIEINSNI